MKSVSQIIEKIQEIKDRERRLLKEWGASSHGGSMSMGALEILQELKNFITGKDDGN